MHGLKGLSAAFVAAVAAMRSDLGFVPPCEQRIILEYLLETRSDITKLLEELHNTVLFYSERNLNMQVRARCTWRYTKPVYDVMNAGA